MSKLSAASVAVSTGSPRFGAFQKTEHFSRGSGASEYVYAKFTMDNPKADRAVIAPLNDGHWTVGDEVVIHYQPGRSEQDRRLTYESNFYSDTEGQVLHTFSPKTREQFVALLRVVSDLPDSDSLKRQLQNALTEQYRVVKAKAALKAEATRKRLLGTFEGVATLLDKAGERENLRTALADLRSGNSETEAVQKARGFVQLLGREAQRLLKLGPEELE